MAAYKLTYSGNQTGGNVLITVPDASIYSIGNIVLPGRNFNGYGSPVDQNMLSMLEHFASSAGGPNQPVTGQMWYDGANATLKYNISTDAIANWAIVPKTDPNGNSTFGNVTLTGNVIIDPPGTITGNGSGITSVNASNMTTGTIPAARMSGTYNINVAGNLTGNVTGNVVGNVTGNAITANFFNGGNIAGTLTTAAQPNITSVGRLTGLTVGNITANTTFGNGTVSASGNITGSNIIASSGLFGNLNSTSITTGSSTTPGTMIGNWTVSAMAVTGPLRSTQLTTGGAGTGGTITGNWTLTPGSRLNATYADLAERHHADKEYPVGTVMKVGGINEVTGASVGDKPLGVVSNEYAYLMNSQAGDDKTHPAVAYCGRVPVRITGPINKHDVIVATLNGCARAGFATEGFGWALETNRDEAEKLVLCIIK